VSVVTDAPLKVAFERGLSPRNGGSIALAARRLPYIAPAKLLVLAGLPLALFQLVGARCYRFPGDRAWLLTIVGGVREEPVVWGRGAQSKLRARGPCDTWSCGPSTSPLAAKRYA
jgi:hypothetical protein